MGQGPSGLFVSGAVFAKQGECSLRGGREGWTFAKVAGFRGQAHLSLEVTSLDDTAMQTDIERHQVGRG